MIDPACAPAAEVPQYSWPGDLMTVRQVADTVLLTPKTVRQHITRGHLRAVRFSARGGYRIRREDAQAWVAAHVVAVDPRSANIDQLIARQRRLAIARAPKAAVPPARRRH